MKKRNSNYRNDYYDFDERDEMRSAYDDEYDFDEEDDEYEDFLEYEYDEQSSLQHITVLTREKESAIMSISFIDASDDQRVRITLGQKEGRVHSARQ